MKLSDLKIGDQLQIVDNNGLYKTEYKNGRIDEDCFNFGIEQARKIRDYLNEVLK